MFTKPSSIKETNTEKKGFMDRLLGLFKKKAVTEVLPEPISSTKTQTSPPTPSKSSQDTQALAEQEQFYNSLLTKPDDKKSASSQPSKHVLPTPPLPPPATKKPSEGHIETLESEMELAKAAADNVTPGEEIKAKEIAAQTSKSIVPAKNQATSSVDTTSASVTTAGKHLSLLDRLFSRNVKRKLVKEKEKELAWQERTQVEKRFWQPANAIKPNLIKNQEVVFFNWHENFLVLGLSLMMCCLTVGLLYVGLLIWQKERLDTTQVALQNSKVIDQQIALGEQEATEIKVFTQKLNLVSSLLDNHVYWSNFLKFLEDNTLKDVYFSSFSGDLSGNYTLPAYAKNLEAISLQLEVMKVYPKIKSLTPDTGEKTADGKALEFNLGMSIDPTIFVK